MLVASVGCGKKLNQATGKVTFEDGAPVKGGIVVFDGRDAKPPVSMRGIIQEDGNYTMGTQSDHDGVTEGTFKVLITPKRPPTEQIPKDWPPFDLSYSLYNKTPFTVTIKPGKNVNDFQVKRKK